MLKSYCVDGESDWLWYAQLMDIYLLKADKPQIYGTQYIFVDNSRQESKLARSLPIAEVNVNRRSIALPELRE